MTIDRIDMLRSDLPLKYNTKEMMEDALGVGERYERSLIDRIKASLGV